MTKSFDRKLEQSQIQCERFFDFFPVSDYKLSDLYVRRGTVREARPYIAAHHYTHTMPDSTKEVYMGFYGDVLAGICVFGMGTGPHQYLRIIPTLKNGEYRELTRVWSPDGMPTNTESKLIGLSLRMLSDDVKFVLSYADSSKGHLGIIYQATNWCYIGMTESGNKMINHLGESVHPRLVSMYKKRHPEKYGNMKMTEIMDSLGWKYLEGSKKHRYCYIRGHKKDKIELYNSILSLIKEYPK